MSVYVFMVWPLEVNFHVPTFTIMACSRVLQELDDPIYRISNARINVPLQ